MRAERLLRVLFALQSQDVVTAARLADDLEVSVATARRDLEALSMAGVPIYPQRGRGGGWRLVGGARTNLTGLTEGEANALAAMLGGIEGAPAEIADVVHKLLQALPATFRGGARRVAAASATSGGWGAVAPASASALLAAARLAIARNVRVRIAYRDREPFDATPLGIGRRGGHDYLLVRRDAETRMLRIDRVGSLEVLDEPGVADVAFADAWQQAVAEVEDMRGGTAAICRVDARAVDAITGAFGMQALVLDASSAATRVELRAHSPEALAEQLAGWSSVLEVEEPSSVRDAMARLGARLVETYGESRI